MDENLDEKKLVLPMLEPIDFVNSDIILDENKKDTNTESFYWNSTRKIKKMSKNEQIELFRNIKTLNNRNILEYFKIKNNKKLLYIAYNDIIKNNNYEDYIEIDHYLSIEKENLENQELNKKQKKNIINNIKSILENKEFDSILYLKTKFIAELDSNLNYYSNTIKSSEKEILSKLNNIKDKKTREILIKNLKSNLYYEINTNDNSINNEISSLQNNIKKIESESGLDIINLKLVIKNVFLNKNKIKFYQDKIIESNLPLVIYTIKNYRNKGIEDSDLIQEGNIGLIKAVEKFNLDKGHQFSTYAIWWIKQGILRTLVENSKMIRIPVYISDSINKLKKYLADNNMTYSDINNNNIDNIAKELKLTKSKILNILQTDTKFLPIHETDEKQKGEKKLSLEEMLSANDEDVESLIFKEERKKIVKLLLGTLSQRSADALKYYYGIGLNRAYSLEEVGEILGLTKERIRQINVDSFERFRNSYRLSTISEIIDDDILNKRNVKNN